MSDHMLELLLANLPNAVGIVILIVMLIWIIKMQGDILDYIVKRLINHEVSDDD